MIDYSQLYDMLIGTPAAGWSEKLPQLLSEAFDVNRNGDLQRWLDQLATLPSITPSSVDLKADCVCVEGAIDETVRSRLIEQLDAFHPWRKGPFKLFDIHIDTEWRSDWKWNRLKQAISPLDGRRVLDVGCGNGYYAWRMLGAGADMVVGIDPYVLYVLQFYAIKHFIGLLPAFVLPLGLEALPESPAAFDTVFSMGVLYHRRDPIEHLQRLKRFLREDGELVLETLVIDEDQDIILEPAGRYASMRNIWQIPSPTALIGWLQRAGFHSIELADVTPTSLDEQRSTRWMRFQSLSDFLDAEDRSKTIEGYPAPVRALLIARS